MSTVDFEHISHLFAIIEGAVQHTGKFGAIQTEAFNELNDINDQLRKKQMDKKAADEKALGEHEARQAKLKAEDKPKAIPSQQFDLSGKPIEDEPTEVDRRI